MSDQTGLMEKNGHSIFHNEKTNLIILNEAGQRYKPSRLEGFFKSLITD
ncbi:hypothetical protein [Photorhabdus viridis]